MKCEQCQRKFTNGEIFCAFCGKKLKNEADEQQNVKNSATAKHGTRPDGVCFLYLRHTADQNAEVIAVDFREL